MITFNLFFIINQILVFDLSKFILTLIIFLIKSDNHFVNLKFIINHLIFNYGIIIYFNHNQKFLNQISLSIFLCHSIIFIINLFTSLTILIL